MEESGHDCGEQEMGKVGSCGSSTYPPSGISVHSGELCEFSQYGANEGQNVKFEILLSQNGYHLFYKIYQISLKCLVLQNKKTFVVFLVQVVLQYVRLPLLNLFLNPHQFFQKYLYRTLKCFITKISVILQYILYVSLLFYFTTDECAVQAFFSCNFQSSQTSKLLFIFNCYIIIL